MSGTAPGSQPFTTSSGRILPIIAGVVVVVMIAGYAVFGRRQPAAVEETIALATATPRMDVMVREEEVAQTPYQDGQYEAVGTYRSPGGEESINVSLVLADGVVTQATVVSNATLPNSVQFQGMFVEHFEEQVVGKNIDELNLTKVSGSSLTPKGFNDAVEQIKAQARG